MRIQIRHVTTYQFDRPVPYGLQRMRLTPKPRPGQMVKDWSITLSTGRIQLSYLDHHANTVDLAVLDPQTSELEIVSQGVVETQDTNGVVGRHGGFVPIWMFQRQTPLTTAGEAITELAESITDPDSVASLHALSEAILDKMPYDVALSPTHATAEEALIHGHGVCMDHAHVFIAAARHAGIPARYVSGYLLVEDQVDHAASHAWAEACLPGLGWVGFDVSNQMSPDERYVKVATGFDYTDAAPIAGVSFGGHGEKLIVSVQVQQ